MLNEARKAAAVFLKQVSNDAFSNFFLANDAGDFSSLAFEAALEIPKKLEHGHLAYPTFSLAKLMRKAPPLIAQDLAQACTGEIAKRRSDNAKFEIETVTAVGGYLNFTFQNSFLQGLVEQSILKVDEKSLGHSNSGLGRRAVIDYSSPNVAKPMHIGHLRATVVGQAIRNLAVTQGYDVVGLNHLGDWGVQFGKLVWAYQQWGAEYDFKQKPFDSLFQMYVRFHDEAEKSPALDDEGSKMFRRLEQGDAEVEKLWRQFVDISMQEYGKVWAMMGVRHDLVRGESFYNDRLKAVEDELEQKGLLAESEGAMVVNLGDDMPPCLIRKTDGASLYATRDLASALYRHNELKADLNLYVVGAEQSLHFKQVFKVLELMGYEWAKDCHHISFGMYRFKDGKMSTRKGRTVFLDDVVTQAVDLVSKVIEEKNPGLHDRDPAVKQTIAKQVGVGAVIFNDLVVDRVRDVEFDWQKVLNFEGDSGPYVQYTHVRCMSLIQKFARPVPMIFTSDLNTAEERELIRVLLNYQDQLAVAFSTFKPSILAQYLLDVCSAFSRFYNKNRILGEAAEVESSRMVLVEASRRVLAAGLSVLNIEAPRAM